MFHQCSRKNPPKFQQCSWKFPTLFVKFSSKIPRNFQQHSWHFTPMFQQSSWKFPAVFQQHSCYVWRLILNSYSIIWQKILLGKLMTVTLLTVERWTLNVWKEFLKLSRLMCSSSHFSKSTAKVFPLRCFFSLFVFCFDCKNQLDNGKRCKNKSRVLPSQSQWLHYKYLNGAGAAGGGRIMETQQLHLKRKPNGRTVIISLPWQILKRVLTVSHNAALMLSRWAEQFLTDSRKQAAGAQRSLEDNFSQMESNQTPLCHLDN